MSFYDEYKPFRNYMRQFQRLQGLIDIWQYSLHIVEGKSLPLDYLADIAARTRRNLHQYLYPWDIDILARELILNGAERRNRSLQRWGDLSVAIDHLRRLGDEAYSRGDAEPADVMLEMHRIAHRQFPWQQKMGANGFIRALKVFGHASVNCIVERELGMSAEQFIMLGTAVTGNFHRSWGMSTEQNYSALGIPVAASQAFFERLSSTCGTLREQTLAVQRYNSDWQYTWNPLQARPLVRFDRDHPARVVCPMPYYLIKRATAGLFYDLVRSSDFDNPFGYSFQSYIGEIAQIFFTQPAFTVAAPAPYDIGSRHLHGVDWIISDRTGHLFLECKTKRLTMRAKSEADTAAVDHDLSVLAEAVVQNFKNMQHAMEGKTAWKSDGMPVFSMILTLEDWFIFSPRVRELLQNNLRLLAAKEGLDERAVMQMPYTVASASEFEVACQIIAQVGIAPLMQNKLENETNWWLLLPFLRQHFPNELRNVNWDFQTRELNELLGRVTKTSGSPKNGASEFGNELATAIRVKSTLRG
ncbi:MAG TPA: hypothetical protein VHU18_09340 [Rhizomicrobium sp.]|jgi:hypothetical protein|nr:hypothetical protein [Rhizomicrobium sp.]